MSAVVMSASGGERTRSLDLRLRPLLDWLHKTIPWFDADFITISGALFLIPWLTSCWYQYFASLPLLCAPMWFSDLTDGPYSRRHDKGRLFGKKGYGGIADATIDKVSNWPRIFYFLYAIAAAQTIPILIEIPLPYQITILGIQAETSVFCIVIALAAIPDLSNTLIRFYAIYRAWRGGGEVADADASENGKRKTWGHHIGIIGFSIFMAGTYATTMADMIVFYTGIAVNCALILWVIPPMEDTPGKKTWRRHWNRWYRPMIRIGIVAVLSLSFFETGQQILGTLAQCALLFAAWYGYRSGWDQIARRFTS